MKSASHLLRIMRRSRESSSSPKAGLLGERAETPKRGQCIHTSRNRRCRGRHPIRVLVESRGRSGNGMRPSRWAWVCRRCRGYWPTEETITPTVGSRVKDAPWEGRAIVGIDIESCLRPLGSLERRVLLNWDAVEPRKGESREIAVLWVLRGKWPRVGWTRDRVRQLYQSACRKMEEEAIERGVMG